MSLWRIITTAGLALAIGACDTGTGESLYDPDRTGGPDPVISEVQPAGSALAGVDVVTITGQNFSSNPDENFAYFGGQQAQLLESSPTVLRVIPPNQPNPDAEVRVSVLGAENFSNEIAYALEAAAESFGAIAGFEELFGMTSDTEGNLYASMFSTNVSAGVIKFAPDGSRTQYVESTFKWDGLAFGPDGMLYTVRNVRAIFRFSEGSAQETWAVIPDNSVSLTAITFDDSGNLWAGGPNNLNLYRATPDGSITEYPFDANVTGLTVFGDGLYASAMQDGTSGVWKFTFDADGGVGAGSLYADLTASIGVQARSIVAASSGELFVGTNGSDPLILVGADQSAEVFYPGILQPIGTALAWGPSPSLYMNQGRTTNTDPNLIKINTGREAAQSFN